jgi:hypothetical protein
MFSRFFITMSKHPRSPSVSPSSHKRSRPAQSTFKPNKVASAAAAAAVDADPPLPKLLHAVRDGVTSPAKGDCVVYWMRMADLRSMSSLLANSSATRSHSPGKFLITGPCLWHQIKLRRTLYLSSYSLPSARKIILPMIGLLAESISP